MPAKKPKQLTKRKGPSIFDIFRKKKPVEQFVAKPVDKEREQRETDKFLAERREEAKTRRNRFQELSPRQAARVAAGKDKNASVLDQKPGWISADKVLREIRKKK